MAKPGGLFRNILIWTYERGTLQYDIICALILAFIFLVPRACFTAKRADASSVENTQTNQQAASQHSQHR
ncbi:MAG: hypothetical protein LAP85_05750 [Acidobacteriia bacterium]|nr:hypothetical protein [Terriglobia bacterium]